MSEDMIERAWHEEQMNRLRNELASVRTSYQAAFEEKKSLQREIDLLRKLLDLYLEKKDEWR